MGWSLSLKDVWRLVVMQRGSETAYLGKPHHPCPSPREVPRITLTACLHHGGTHTHLYTSCMP